MSPHAAGARGRLVFALDATMSRRPTWDMACALRADMFREAASLGAASISASSVIAASAECRATAVDFRQRATGQADGQDRLPRRQHPDRQGVGGSATRPPPPACARWLFVGDAMEEAIDDLCAKAGELGLLKVPVFMFQEGHDAVAEQAFQEIARLTGGAWCRFDPGAAAQLRPNSCAAAAYAAGGRAALLRLSNAAAPPVLGQMRANFISDHFALASFHASRATDLIVSLAEPVPLPSQTQDLAALRPRLPSPSVSFPALAF